MIPRIRGNVQVKDDVCHIPNPITLKNDFSESAVHAFSERAAERGFRSEAAEDGFISIVKNLVLDEEAYTLSIEKEGIRIEGNRVLSGH